MWHKQLKHYKKKLIQNETPNHQTKESVTVKSQSNQTINAELSFSDYCKNQNIVPLKQDTHLPEKPHNNNREIVNHVQKISSEESFDFFNIEDTPKEFYRYGQKNLPKELRLNKYPISHTLDLHNFTKAHALQLVEQLLEAAAPASCLKIIHGWGINSESNQPILMGTIRKYLLNHRRILAYSYGATNQGGNGITLVKLTK